MTFFLVREPKKKWTTTKLVPRLLGITKNAVIRLDEKSKEVIQEWPLDHIQSYYNSENFFTLCKFELLMYLKYNCKVYKLVFHNRCLISLTSVKQTELSGIFNLKLYGRKN